MTTAPDTTNLTAAEIAASATTLCGAFQATAARRGDGVALRTPEGEAISWSAYAEKVAAIAAGLAAHGIGRGDTVAMMLTNRPECYFVDTAALHLGATPFSIYNTFAPEQIEYVVGNSSARVVVTEKAFADRVLAVPGIEYVVVVDGPVPGTTGLDELIAAGAADFDFEASWRSVTPDDVATLIYTSGTTGPPKGVELSHHNLVWTGRAWLEVTGLDFDGSLMSYLPMAHLADRVVAHYFSILTGGASPASPMRRRPCRRSRAAARRCGWACRACTRSSSRRWRRRSARRRSLRRSRRACGRSSASLRAASCSQARRRCRCT